MSKAVLVMDMPENCKECNMSILSREPHTGQMCFRCVHHPMFLVEIKKKTKPDWCPLKPMPEKKVLSGDVADIQKMGKELVDIGYNACIDELLKEE